MMSDECPVGKMKLFGRCFGFLMTLHKPTAAIYGACALPSESI